MYELSTRQLTCNLGTHLAFAVVPVPDLVLGPGILAEATAARPYARARAATPLPDSHRAAAVHLVSDLQNLAPTEVPPLFCVWALRARVRHDATRGHEWPCKTNATRATTVRRYDHHCPFVNNCVGVRNHFYFLSFLAGVVGLGVTVMAGTSKRFVSASI